MLTLTGAGIATLLDVSDGRLGVARTTGPVAGHVGDAIAWVLIEGGAGMLVLNDRTVKIPERGDVFSRAGWSALATRNSDFSLDGDLRATVVWRLTDRDATARLIPPDIVATEKRGRGPFARRVRTYVPEGMLIAGETLNQAGCWSSYPPHRHEHEEVYLYRFAPDGGFGLSLNYDDTASDARMVRDGDVQRIVSGYHPVVAAPGYEMYYLWVLAGTSDTVAPEFDPAHAAIS